MLKLIKKLFGATDSEHKEDIVYVPDPQLERDLEMKLVYALSLSGAMQIEVIGPPIPGDEMIVDYYFGYTGKKEEVHKLNIFTDAQIVALDQLGDTLLRFQEDHSDIDYLLYEPSSLLDDPRWELIRQQARECLEICDFSSEAFEPEVVVTRTPEYVLHNWQLNERPKN